MGGTCSAEERGWPGCGAPPIADDEVAEPLPQPTFSTLNLYDFHRGSWSDGDCNPEVEQRIQTTQQTIDDAIAAAEADAEAANRVDAEVESMPEGFEKRAKIADLAALRAERQRSAAIEVVAAVDAEKAVIDAMPEGSSKEVALSRLTAHQSAAKAANASAEAAVSTATSMHEATSEERERLEAVASEKIEASRQAAKRAEGDAAAVVSDRKGSEAEKEAMKIENDMERNGELARIAEQRALKLGQAAEALQAAAAEQEVAVAEMPAGSAKNKATEDLKRTKLRAETTKHAAQHAQEEAVVLSGN